MILQQIVGAGLMLLGFGMVFVFPDIIGNVAYQPKAFSNTGILIGIFLIVLGAYLLLV